MIITRTPYRVSLFGGGTDHPIWYQENNGRVISFTIDKFCYITIKFLPPFFEHKTRVVYSKIEEIENFAEIQHPLVRSVFQHYFETRDLKGIEIHHHGELPARSGIASSSAFAVGTIHAVRELLGMKVDRLSLAKEAIFFERDVLKESVGDQDQFACSVGGFNIIEFNSNEVKVKKIIMNSADEQFLEQSLVLMFTGVQRNSTDINQNLLHRLSNKLTSLEETMQISKQASELLTRSLDLTKLSNLMQRAWELKLEANPEVSNNGIVSIFSKASQKGALAWKILGAGGGGFCLFIVDPENRDRFIARMLSTFPNLVYVPFRISKQGTESLSK